MLYPESARLLARARALTPGGSQTLSRQSSMWGEGGAPAVAQRAKGPHLWDADGRRYVDWLLGLGSVVLGHAHPEVDEAVIRRIRDGAHPTLSTRLEADVAELLSDAVPCAEMSRFVKTGTEACMAAVRIARAATGREMILVCGYHGWADWYAATKAKHPGVPAVLETLAHAFPYNDLDALQGELQAHEGKVAAVMLEPTLYEAPKPGFLVGVRDLAHAHGALLIFDEVVTGFRWASGGAQEYFGIVPDLATLGKAMGNGYPIAAIVGRREIMDPHALVVSSTFGGEGVGLAAAKAVLEIYRREPVVEHLWRVGGEFARRTTESAWGLPFVVDGFACKPRLRCTDADPERARLLMSLVLQQAAARGVLLHLSGENVSFAHGEAELYETAVALRDTFALGREALADGNLRERLVGEPYVEGFRAITEEGHGGPR